MSFINMERLLLGILLVLIAAGRSSARVQSAAALLHELESVDDATLSARIRQLLRHYQSDDPVGLPGGLVPDRQPIPDFRRVLAFGTIHCHNMSVSGLSRFRVRQLSAEVATMKMSLTIDMEAVQLAGQLSLRRLFSVSRQQWNFVIQPHGVYLGGDAQLVVDRSGAIQASNVDLDMGFSSMNLEVENLSLLDQMVKGMFHGLEVVVFEAAKPILLQMFNENVRTEFNRQLMQMPRRFPDSVYPLDMIVADTRNQLREEGYDPLVLPPRGVTGLWSRANLTELRVTGAASLYRSGDLVVTMRGHVLTVDLDFATVQLVGYCKWEVAMAKWLTHSGELQFSVDQLRVRVTAEQPTDIRRHATLRALRLDVGEIQARSSGLGTVSYLLDGLLTVVPSLLSSALEEPLKRKFEQAMAETDLEQLVERHLPAVRKRVKAVKQHYQTGNITRL